MSTCWLEDQINKIDGQRQTIDQIPNSKPKIQMFAPHMRERNDFNELCSPKMVSFGPIHHGKKNLQLGEQYKIIWATMYLKETEQSSEILHGNLAKEIEELKKLFSQDALGDYDDSILGWMLFVDGCSVLHVLRKAVHGDRKKDLKIKIDQMVLLQHDLLLLENQIPYKVLKLLSKDNGASIAPSMKNFLKMYNNMVRLLEDPELRSSVPQHVITIEPADDPAHLLDCLRTIILPSRKTKKEQEEAETKKEEEQEETETKKKQHQEAETKKKKEQEEPETSTANSLENNFRKSVPNKVTSIYIFTCH